MPNSSTAPITSAPTSQMRATAFHVVTSGNDWIVVLVLVLVVLIRLRYRRRSWFWWGLWVVSKSHGALLLVELPVAGALAGPAWASAAGRGAAFATTHAATTIAHAATARAAAWSAATTLGTTWTAWVAAAKRALAAKATGRYTATTNVAGGTVAKAAGAADTNADAAKAAFATADAEALTHAQAGACIAADAQAGASRPVATRADTAGRSIAANAKSAAHTEPECFTARPDAEAEPQVGSVGVGRGRLRCVAPDLAKGCAGVPDLALTDGAEAEAFADAGDVEAVHRAIDKRRKRGGGGRGRLRRL